jgi:ATP-dependent helicase/nuclease subunit B
MKILEGLWGLVGRDGCRDYSDTIIFMPSRRSIQAFEKTIVQKTGGAVLLPKMVPLGQGDGGDFEEEPVPKTDRVLALAKRVRDWAGGDMDGAIQTASMLVQTADYIDTEEVPRPDWGKIIPDSFGGHFSAKARLLELAKPTEFSEAQKRVADIRGWVRTLNTGSWARVFACGSTGSIPATRDLLAHIAKMPNGTVVLPGKITKMPGEMPEGHPYWAQGKLLEKCGIKAGQVGTIDTGISNIDFLNSAWTPGNTTAIHTPPKLIECERESQEMDAAADIIQRAGQGDKSVLVISPDISASYRLMHNLGRMGIAADLSIGQPAGMLPLARLLISILEIWSGRDKTMNAIGILKHKLARNRPGLDEFIKENFRDKPGQFSDLENLDPVLFEILSAPRGDFAGRLTAAAEYITDTHPELFSDESKIVWNALMKAGGGELADWKAEFIYLLNNESVRPAATPAAKISVLGTIEARMIPSDTVVICGLNEGMFPKKGFLFPWLPPALSEKAGLPGAGRKAGLMAMDFINLSCAADVYWTRSRVMGRAPSIQSRFLSRMEAADKERRIIRENWRPKIPEFAPLPAPAPAPPAQNFPVYATALDTLFHNPFEFYAKHILKLRPFERIRSAPDARDYGNLAHKAIENSDNLTAEFNTGAEGLMRGNPSGLFFWKKRFAESVPVIMEMLALYPAAKTEIKGSAELAGRTVKARADRISGASVIDIKTGGAPTKKSLDAGNSPQLPITAYILEAGGFSGIEKRAAESIVFLDLKDNRIKPFDAALIMAKTIERCREIFNKYAKDGAEYNFVPRFGTSDAKYHTADHLFRV